MFDKSKLIPFVYLSVGVVFGVIAGSLYTGNMMAKTMLLLKQDTLYNNVSDSRATYAYSMKSVAEWQIKRTLAMIEDYREFYPDTPELDILAVEMHGRLAMIARAQEDEGDNYRIHMDSALAISRDHSSSVISQLQTEEAIRAFISKIDVRPGSVHTNTN